jgi:hypothetical protein
MGILIFQMIQELQSLGWKSIVIAFTAEGFDTIILTLKLKVSFIENFQWEVFLHDCITYLSKYLFIVLLLDRLQIKWETKKKEYWLLLTCV